MNASARPGSKPVLYQRNAFAPGILGGLVCLAGAFVLGWPGYEIILYVIAILALICAWFAAQAKQWWWIVVFVAIAVLWNPVFPLDLNSPDVWLGLQYGAALVFLAAGILIKVVDTGGASAKR